MVQTLTGGSGIHGGPEDLVSIDGDPDPIWSDEERLAFEAELTELERIVRAAPKAGKLLWREVVSYSEEAIVPPFNKGPYKRLGSLALSAN